MSVIEYEPVNEPPDPVEAFARDDSAAAQAQAAVLLTLAWSYSGDDVDEMDDEGIGYAGVRPLAAPIAAVRVGPDAIAERLASFSRMSFADARQQLFVEHRQQADPVAAATLFRLSLDSPDPLVRVAAATGYLETGLETERPLEILREGAESQIELVRSVAQTSISKIAQGLRRPEISGLDYEGPSQPLETTVIVHGTRFGPPTTWWRSGGDFYEYLLSTGVFPDLYSGPDPFYWSGEYDAAERVDGASKLVQWLQQHDGGPVTLITHSHGGSVAMLASWAPLSIDRLILLSCPVHWRKYQPNFTEVKQAASIRVHLDLIILADRGGQRFRDPRIQEHVLPLWFNHSASHDPTVWQTRGVLSMLP